MKTVLVGPEIEENLALGYLKSSLSRTGHECSIIAFNHDHEVRSVARRVLHHKPELVGFSLVAQRRYAGFQHLAQLLRERGFAGHITAGGHFASLRPSEILHDSPEFDSILHHDGEVRIVALMKWRDFSTDPPEELDGITWRSADGTLHHRPAKHAVDVDSLPFPARRTPGRTLGFALAPMVTSRGCAGACSFCSIHAWHRQVPRARLRFRSPEYLVKEMVTLHQEYGVRVFVFHDDDFIHPNRVEALKRCRAFLEPAEQGIGEPFAFVIKCRPDNVDEKLFLYLKSKGLTRVYIGIETHSELGMRTLNRRVTKQQNEQALSILHNLGIFACFNLLIFHPDSTMDELEENLSFLEHHLDCPFDIARTELYARSSLEERMLREGRALGDYRGYDYRISDPVAEATFGLFADVLWERHFGSKSILHSIQDLGYRLSLLQRFYPNLSSRDLQARVRSLIREVNSDTVQYMRRLSVTARAVGGEIQTEECKQLADNMRQEIAVRVRQQSNRLAVLSFELELRAKLARLGITPSSFGIEWPKLIVRFATAIPPAALLLSAVSCNRETVCDPPPPPIRFSTDIAPHLNQTCAVPGCHSVDSDSANLVLTTDSSYANLVGRTSTQVPRLKRVEPFQPDSSYFVHKLLGTQQTVGGTGVRMPKGGQPEGGFVQRVRAWILDGAKKD